MVEPMRKNGWNGTIKGMPVSGQIARRSRTTSMRDIEAFTEMTGDRNPVHYDESLAKRTPFGKLIVQGGVTSGILNALVAEDLPGPGTVFLACDWKFLKPVGVDEEITGSVEVLTVREDKPICTLRTQVRDAAGDLCIDGTAATFTMALDPALAGQE